MREPWHINGNCDPASTHQRFWATSFRLVATIGLLIASSLAGCQRTPETAADNRATRDKASGTTREKAGAPPTGPVLADGRLSPEARRRVAALEAEMKRKQQSQRPAVVKPVKPPEIRDWLCDLDERNVVVASESFGKKGLAGFAPGAIVINGIPSHHGLGMRANAHVEYQLGKKYHTFRGSAAICDSAGKQHCRPVEFRVLGDGKPLWTSYPFDRAGSGEPCLVDVTGVDSIRLEVQFVPATTGNEEAAHTAWIEPYVSEQPVTPEALRLFNPERFNEHHQRESELANVRPLFDDEKFADLEAMAKDLRAKDIRCGGLPMLYLFYQAMTTASDTGDEGWQKHFDRVDRWQKSQPNSVTPLVVLGESYVNYAWQVRGHDVAARVPTEAWPKFEARVAKAREYLEQAETIGADTETYNALIGVAQVQGAEPDEVIKLVEKGRQLSPRYIPLYGSAANCMLPQWSGDELGVQKFAARMQHEIGGDLGDEVYFRIALQAIMDRADQYLIGRRGITYADLQPGIKVALRDYPDDNAYVGYACFLACTSFHDEEIARLLLTRIDPATFTRRPWGIYDELEKWRQSLNAGTNLHYVPVRKRTRNYYGNIAFLGETNRLLASGGAPALEIITAEQSAEHDQSIPVEPNVGGMAVDSGGKTAIIRWLPQPSGSSHDAQVLTLGTAEPPIALRGHRADIIAVAINRDGSRCGTVAADNTAKIWDLDHPDKPIVLDSTKDVVAIAFSPDGKIAATAGVHGTIQLWNAETGAAMGKPLGIEGKDHLHCRLRFLPDGKGLVWSGKVGIIRCWTIADQKVVREAPIGGDFISQMEVSPDGDWLAIGREGGTLDIMDLGRLKIIHSRPVHFASISGLAFSADGEWLATSALDGTLKVMRTDWKYQAPDGP
jgi:hypothetical protein